MQTNAQVDVENQVGVAEQIGKVSKESARCPNRLRLQIGREVVDKRLLHPHRHVRRPPTLRRGVERRPRAIEA